MDDWDGMEYGIGGIVAMGVLSVSYPDVLGS